MEFVLELLSVEALEELLSFDVLLKLLLGLLVGLCLGLTGVGGGVLIIPLLQVCFGMHTIMAVGTASLIATLTKVNAGFSHVVAGNVEWRSLKWMLIGAIPATLLTTQLIVKVNQIPSASYWVNLVMEIAIFVIMIASLLIIISKYRQAGTVKNEKKARSKSVIVSAGVTCGTVLGSTGVGGGVMLLPAFNSLVGLDIKKSVGSSIVMALVLSSLTALNYSRGGQSDITTAILMTIGAFIGVPLAVRLMKLFSHQKIYMLTIMIIGVSLLLLILNKVI